MVSRKTPKCKAIIPVLALFAIVAFTAFVINVLVVSVQKSPEPESDNNWSADRFPETEEIVEKEPEIQAVSLQPIVDEWAESVGGSKGIIIYDLDRQETIGEYNADEMFGTASLYKLFAVYEGYKRVEDGEWDPEATTGWYGDSMIDCLDSAIRSSDSSCAEPIWAKIGHYELDDIIAEEWEIKDAMISGLKATPRAIMKMMKKFYEHPDFKDAEMVARMWDSFLNQPIVNGYEWRQGLPSGFSDVALVYNKVGWQWTGGDDGHWVIYDDAAIVEFPDLNRHFIVVVMTNNVRYQSIRNFGQMLEESILEQLS